MPPRSCPRPQRRRFASLRAVLALVLREMATTHGRSPGGYLWAVLEPVAGIALLTLIFSAVFRAPPLGINFPIFYATGMIPFLMFLDLSAKVAGALNFSKPLLVYPSVTFVDAILARFIVTFMTQLVVAYVVLGGIVFVFETRTAPDLAVIAKALSMSATLALGLGTLNCFLFSMVPIWPRVWAVLTRPLFILACTMFAYESVPQPFRDYLWYNPLIHIVGYMRHGFYPTYDATYVSTNYVAGVSLGLMVVGLVLLKRHHRALLNDG